MIGWSAQRDELSGTIPPPLRTAQGSWVTPRREKPAWRPGLDETRDRRETPAEPPGRPAGRSPFRRWTRFPRFVASSFGERPRSKPTYQRETRFAFLLNRAPSFRIFPRSPCHRPVPASSRICFAFARRTKSSKARSIVREYVLSPASRVASSSRSSRNTTFVRFMCIASLCPSGHRNKLRRGQRPHKKRPER